MKYIVIKRFYDMKDPKKHVYEIGEKFPFDDRKISKKRLNSLLTDDNNLKTPVIFEKVESNENSDNSSKSDELND